MDSNELFDRFQTHQPTDDVVTAAHERVRDHAYRFAEMLDTILPDSREKSLAMTKIEEAMFWANASVARTQLKRHHKDND
jgi:hypothetical protein